MNYIKKASKHLTSDHLAGSVLRLPQGVKTHFEMTIDFHAIHADYSFHIEACNAD